VSKISEEGKEESIDLSKVKEKVKKESNKKII